MPPLDHELIQAQEIAALKARLLASGLSIPQLVETAWASASTFRGTDKRGGANGARIRLAPQKDWAVNNPPALATALSVLEQIQQDFNAQAGNRTVSLADLIVLGGCAAIEKAAKDAGIDVQVPFTPGRTDATQEQTDAESFAVLEPDADAFRNYVGPGHEVPAEHLMVERAFRLTLSAPELTVLVGGLRALSVTAGQTSHGVLTTRPGVLTNDFFVNLLDMGTQWQPISDAPGAFEGTLPDQGRAQVDRQPGRSRLRIQLRAAGARRGLRERRREGEVRARLRRDVGQGDEPRSFRPPQGGRTRRRDRVASSCHRRSRTALPRGGP